MAVTKLVSLALTKSEQAEETKEAQEAPPTKYPWGLQFRLEEEELEKLGLKNPPEVGGEIHFEAVADVTAVSEQTMADGSYDCCVTLQIKMMGIELEESEKEEEGESETPEEEERETRSSLMSKYRSR